MKYGFVKVAAAVPEVRVADCKHNAAAIARQMALADKEGVELIVFPELCITGYTCGDLFGQRLLLDEALEGVESLLKATDELAVIAIVGMPLALPGGQLLNAAVVIQRGAASGVVPKSYLPNYKEFYEKRWFTSALDVAPGQRIRLGDRDVPLGADLLFTAADVTFGIEICEDVWAPTPPSERLSLRGADIIFNLSANPEGVGKHDYLRSLLAQQSARCIGGYVYSSCGFGESSTDLVFAGNGLIYENGTLLASTPRFSFDARMAVSEIDVERLRAERRVNTTFAACAAHEAAVPPRCVPVASRAVVPSADTPVPLTRTFPAHPFVPEGPALDERCEEIFSIQISGLAQRLRHTRARTAVVGISGGLDSTLALLVCAKTFDKLGWERSRIIGITMPGFGTTGRTRTNAVNLMTELGVTMREIDITAACTQHFADIGHDPALHDVVYENAQARERTQILMDVANQTGGLVIGTGDLSELALGWATSHGDHMSMYGVNVSIPKTLVRHLVRWIALHEADADARATLLDIIDTPISPELIPADADGNITQRTEDLVGPYELHDFFLYYFLRFGFCPAKLRHLAVRTFSGVYDAAAITHWLRTFIRRFFAQQFKRSCLPDGPKVGSISISPRGDWRMPSDATVEAWLADLD
ncbi:MAG: NAD(+) synthase [Prevotellaceae bacterium]|jgi:NAD+ synthase (glutamine-hydrolysing)|nr:NAD(+) synthase [Prevotellaceae bacterium]